MYLCSISSAVPQLAYSQQECWQSFLRSPYAPGLPDSARSLVEKVLTAGQSGIAKRHFALGEQQLFGMDAQALNEAFEREAPRLAAEALKPALERAGVEAAELDALFVCTCTGYLCPGISSYLAEAVGVRPDAVLNDVVGLGCGAAIPTLRAAAHFLAAETDARAAVVAVELCSAAFYLDADPHFQPFGDVHNQVAIYNKGELDYANEMLQGWISPKLIMWQHPLGRAQRIFNGYDYAYQFLRQLAALLGLFGLCIAAWRRDAAALFCLLAYYGNILLNAWLGVALSRYTQALDPLLWCGVGAPVVAVDTLPPWPCGC